MIVVAGIDGNVAESTMNIRDHPKGLPNLSESSSPEGDSRIGKLPPQWLPAPDGDSRRINFAAPGELAPYIAPKGSITVDGVSLTVNEVEDQPDGSCHFSVNIIPHTAEVTTLGELEAGSQVNLEIDVLARYLQRMQNLRG